MHPIPHALRPWLALGGLLADAAEAGAVRVQKNLTQRRTPAGYARRPGADSPMWNALAARLRARTRAYGSQARLARYLGVPRQRLHNFLVGRSRLPDAELTLRLLHWLAEAGRDPTL
jgi:predicted nucleic acid-binding Zn ribbon protein